MESRNIPNVENVDSIDGEVPSEGRTVGTRGREDHEVPLVLGLIGRNGRPLESEPKTGESEARRRDASARLVEDDTHKLGKELAVTHMRRGVAPNLHAVRRLA